MPTESAIGPAIPPSFFCSFVSYPNKVGPATTSATTGLFKVYIRHVLAVDPVHKQKQPSVCPVQQLDLLMKRGYRPLLGNASSPPLGRPQRSTKEKQIPFVFLSLSAAVVCVLALRSSCKSLSLKGRRRMETT